MAGHRARFVTSGRVRRACGLLGLARQFIRGSCTMRVLRSAVALSLVTAVAAACSSTPHERAPAHGQGGPASRAPVLAAMYAAGRSDPVADSYYPERGHPAVDVLHYGLA